jgi:hypothetical protein
VALYRGCRKVIELLRDYEGEEVPYVAMPLLYMANNENNQ